MASLVAWAPGALAETTTPPVARALPAPTQPGLPLIVHPVVAPGRRQNIQARPGTGHRDRLEQSAGERCRVPATAPVGRSGTIIFFRVCHLCEFCMEFLVLENHGSRFGIQGKCLWSLFLLPNLVFSSFCIFQGLKGRVKQQQFFFVLITRTARSNVLE